jgi:hypothetical protein
VLLRPNGPSRPHGPQRHQRLQGRRVPSPAERVELRTLKTEERTQKRVRAAAPGAFGLSMPPFCQ